MGIAIKPVGNVDYVSKTEDETISGDKTFSAETEFSAGLNFGGDTLDDYEEGTWTPVLGGATSESGQSYSVQAGTYTKTGDTVVCTAQIAFTDKGTISGILKIKGFPFTSSLSAKGAGLAIGQATYWTLSSGHVLISYIGANTTTATFLETSFTGDGFTTLSTSVLANNSTLLFSVTYKTAS
jgi:hypothetical protein